MTLPLLAARCAGGSSPASSPLEPLCSPIPATPSDPPSATAKPASTAFAHIVVVVQENRSFDNMFAANGGFPGADTVEQGLNSHGATAPLQAIGYELDLGPQHAAADLVRSWDQGKMDKFDLTPYQRGAL